MSERARAKKKRAKAPPLRVYVIVNRDAYIVDSFGDLAVAKAFVRSRLYENEFAEFRVVTYRREP